MSANKFIERKHLKKFTKRFAESLNSYNTMELKVANIALWISTIVTIVAIIAIAVIAGTSASFDGTAMACQIAIALVAIVIAAIAVAIKRRAIVKSGYRFEAANEEGEAFAEATKVAYQDISGFEHMSRKDAFTVAEHVGTRTWWWTSICRIMNLVSFICVLFVLGIASFVPDPISGLLLLVPMFLLLVEVWFKKKVIYTNKNISEFVRKGAGKLQ